MDVATLIEPQHKADIHANAFGRLNTKTGKVLIWLCCCAALCLIAATAFFAWVAWTLAHPAIAPLSADPMQRFGAPYENVNFLSHTHNRPLAGWYIPGNNSAETVIFSHGYAGNREERWVPIYDLAKALHQRNYNVLMFDYGYADMKRRFAVTAGVNEAGDLLGAIAYAREQGAARVYVWGFSMGAGTALQAALQGNRLDGMILDSTFLLNRDTLAYNLRQSLHLPEFPATPLLRFLFPYVAGFSLGEIPVAQVMDNAYPFPIFFIHGKKDSKSSFNISKEIYARQTNSLSRAWFPEKRGHEMTYRFQSEQYLQETLGFLENISIAANASHREADGFSSTDAGK